MYSTLIELMSVLQLIKHHTIKTYWGIVLITSALCGGGCQLRQLLLYHLGKKPRYRLEKRTCWPQGKSGQIALYIIILNMGTYIAFIYAG
jgi:hypothetical protein